MRTDSFLGLSPHGFHRVHYTDWGEADNPHIVICVHGLTRTCRDFDFLARALAPHCRVVCPDMPGRGRSDWLTHAEDYTFPVYLAAATALIARVTATPPADGASARIDWVGTSMGGYIGMMFAGQPGSPISRLVLNDVSPLVPRALLSRLASYVGTDPRFPSFDALDAYVREVSSGFGPLSDEQWRHLTRHAARQHADGSWGFAYDPAIGAAFRGLDADIDVWPLYDALACPTLLLRGKLSDMLSADVAAQMRQRGPKARLIEFDGVGHAPVLMDAAQIEPVRDFLLG